ncbi:MAG: nucleoside-diphosphate sugar epimerase/dehydratase [Cyclobacteriaceae bacterium]|nr:nucleoside-diphosphate sugar epimerase/dehydratase [Cyclobacteriaceae bacterium]
MLTRFIRNLKILPRWVIIALDLSIISFSVFLGYLLRFNFSVSELQINNVYSGILLHTTMAFLAILITGSYKGIIRYTGIQDGVRIFFMLVLTAALVTLINFFNDLNYQTYIIPYSVILITFLSSFLLLFNYRLLVKYLFSYYRNSVTRKSRVLIYGAGHSGMITKQVIDASPDMVVVGFIEDDAHKTGKFLAGSQIYPVEKLEDLLDELQVNELVITIKDLGYEKISSVVDICLRNRVKVRNIPPLDRWVRQELSIKQIREIKIEDLLEREAIRLPSEHVARELSGRIVCVTGAAGSIGSEIARQVLNYSPSRLILIDQNESALFELERTIRLISRRVPVFPYLADITNEARMLSIFEEHKPHLVFHAAAYKHVPLMESHPAEAVLCNILGTKIVADVAVKTGVEKFVMISTDKAVNPTSIMGCSKRIAELYVQALNNQVAMQGNSHKRTAFITTRFGNVLGSNGSVIPIFKKQIEEGGPVTVTHPEITRYFMTIQEACQLVLEAGAMGSGGEVFIFDMGQSIKILDLARKMIRLSGFEPNKDIQIVFTGLREGEKLHEELLFEKENLLPTHHHKIMKARISEVPYQEINNMIELFWELISDRNELKMVALMKELVPEFKSNYSRYEVLDKQL